MNVKKHSFKHDYSDIQSALELKLGAVDHWCLDGGDKNCALCEDPTMPSNRIQNKGWVPTFKRNINLSRNFLNENPDGVDVIFLGDSNTEARVGTFMTSEGEGDFATVLGKSKHKFDKEFKKKEGGRFNGLALGIAGDTSVNLLWRIQQNEFKNLKPKVWWINIGSNDLFSTKCSEEITIMGILRVVEELMSLDDGASIVINSLFPVATQKSMSLEGKYVHNKFWYSIHKVNERLQTFARKHPGVKFFNADSILTETKGRNLYMKKELFADKMHLSEKGQAELSKAQADTLENILKKLEGPTPASSNSNTNTNTNTNTGDYRDGDMASDGDDEGDDENENWYSEQGGMDDDFMNYYDWTGEGDEGVDDWL